MLDQCQKYDVRILSRREEFGVVARCPNGCIHICVGNTALRTLDRTIPDVNGLVGGSGAENRNPWHL